MVASIFPLSISGAVVRKKGRTILGPLDLQITGEKTTVIIGPNGSGKTTLLRLVHGIERLREGKINWHIDKKAAHARQSFVFQAPIMLRRSVYENVIFPLKLGSKSAAEVKASGLDWLQRVGLSELAKNEAASLSGGEKQKLSLARALITSPELLFLDEPTANLDGTSTREIETILSEAIGSGVNVLLTTHDIGQARRMADEIIFLHRGQILEFSSASEFFEKPATPEAQSFLRGEIVE